MAINFSQKLNRRTFLKALGLAAGAATLRAGIGHAQPPLRIGVIGPTDIFVGIGIRDGAILAAEEIKTVLGRPIELVFADDKDKPEVGIPAFEDLVVTKGCKACVGLFRSEVAEAILGLPLWKDPKVRVPLLITGATFPGHTAKVATDYANYKYVFRPMLNGSFLAVNLLEFAGAYLAPIVVPAVYPARPYKVAVVAEDLLWTRPVTDLLGATLPRMGLEVAAIHRAAVGIPTFGPILSDIAAKGAKITIMVFSEPADGIKFVSEWAALKVPTALFGINAVFHSPGAARLPAAEWISEMEIAGDYAITLTPKTMPFIEKYKARFPRDPIPVYTSFITYDSVYLVAEAMKRAGTDAADPIVTELEKMDWVGVSGNLRFYGLKPAEEDPAYGRFAFPHDSRYGWDGPLTGAGSPKWVYPLHVQIRSGGRKGVFWPYHIGPGTATYLLPPWMR